jgi:hypothetical protein
MSTDLRDDRMPELVDEYDWDESSDETAPIPAMWFLINYPDIIMPDDSSDETAPIAAMWFPYIMPPIANLPRLVKDIDSDDSFYDNFDETSTRAA